VWADSDPSFEAFYERERPRLLALAVGLCRRGQLGAAEDLVQDAFVRAYERWDQVAGYERPELWLRRVAINLSTSRARRLATELRRAARLRHDAEARERALDDDAATTLDALRHLPRRQAQVLALRFIDQLSTDDISEVLGMAPGTVRTHLRRGLDALRADGRFAADSPKELVP